MRRGVRVAGGDAEDREARHRAGSEDVPREPDAVAGFSDPRGGFHPSTLATDP